ncbi:hypothetical protein C8F04DRAFT_1264555 [Mycena alexandri]|uniref:Uncharacterized protein n=1 Tax=Mycena alexandri TaxID=1745969 RepID=A0AAD6SP16_9AGAR|nr:hypothetical protein C8F04DRAFT_1264555 [Mycena alexandri]
MSAPLHNIHPATRLPPAPPGYVSFKAQRPALLAGGSGPMAIAGCTLRASTYPVTGTQTHPPSTEIHTATGADRTLHAVRGRACKHVLYGLSCTHHLICPAPTLLLPPGPLHRQIRRPFPLPIFIAGYTQAHRGRVVAPPFLSPLSSSQLGHAHAIPISLSPPFNGPQGAPMRMRTSFPGSKCAHCKEVERRACAGAKHEARAAAALPRHITSVEIMCAPSPGVTIGLVPKPEPEFRHRARHRH